MRSINPPRNTRSTSERDLDSSLPVQAPRLLVSVRNSAEADMAIAGGCDILDVKEPHRGSLGMAAYRDLRDIAEVATQRNPEILLSAALGEVEEHAPGSVVTLPAEYQLVKLGCAHLGQGPDWQQRWLDVRHAISKNLWPISGWVAVAYADFEAANAPAPCDVIAAASTTGCRGVLFDTFDKSNGRLLNWISVPELQDAAERVHAAGMFLALAGSLRLEDLPHLSQVPADVIAIRGAACIGNQRTSEISQAAIHEFRESLHQTWQRRRLAK